MDRRTRWQNAVAAAWRVLVAAAAIGGAFSLFSAHHAATALMLAMAAAFAMADAWVELGRCRVVAVSALTDVGAVREAERLRALIDAVATALFVLDEQGRIVMANRAARVLAGADVVRLDDVAVLGPDALARIRELAPGARRMLRAADGRNLLAWAGRFTIPEQLPQRLLSLQWVAGELDAVQVAAWHAMTRVLTHEMMNSLTPVVSLAESLAAMPDHAPPTAQALATIARRSTHLLHFVERYRLLGELPQPVRVPTDLAALLGELLQAVEPELAAAGITASLEGVERPAMIAVDPELMERALLNVLRNAIEASQGKGDQRIDLVLAVDPAGLTISMRDHGMGIPEDRLEEIFVPFFSTKSGGSGVGLPLSRQIAALHGGTLVAIPAAPGLCFKFFLPF